MKYALAVAPKIDGSKDQLSPGTLDGFLTLTYRKNKAATDVTYIIVISITLVGNNWTTITEVVSASDHGDYWLVTIKDSEPKANHPARFMRLRVVK
ncbi:MAG: hypothetical protein H8M99_13980 [Gloeobacteraceae cyanobacterium ES-bin-144]|nr:hypothetical protein [Verrucomicrobiales bacterium]